MDNQLHKDLLQMAQDIKTIATVLRFDISQACPIYDEQVKRLVECQRLLTIIIDRKINHIQTIDMPIKANPMPILGV